MLTIFKSKNISASGLAWFLLILLSIIWGSSFILIKKALLAFSPSQVGAGRIVIAFLAFLPLFIRHYKKINGRILWPLIVVGLCGSGFPAFLYAFAQTHIPSAVAGVLNSLTPIFTFVLGIFIFQQVFKWSQLSGVIVGFLGVLIISMAKGADDTPFPFFYAGLILIGTIFYAISANTVKKYLGKVDPVLISTFSFIIIGPFVLLYLLNSSFIETVSTHPDGYKSLVSLLVLSLIGTFSANILFFKLVQLTDAVFSSSVSFLIPFVALFWGFIDGEYLGLYHFLALFLIILGVVLIKLKR